MPLYFLAFLVSTAFVVAAGVVLTRSADSIAQATGLNRAWIGAMLFSRRHIAA